MHANSAANLVNEVPALLDPCNKNDVKLLAFEMDGRPILSPQAEGNQIAIERIKISNLLLNLDYPNFNQEREKIYNKVKNLVLRGDRYLLEGVGAIDDVRQDLIALMEEHAE